MGTAEYDLAELKRAYQVLGVPPSASASSIKQSYRRLTKRWHPDLYASGTPAHDEATQMMKLINQAYANIAHAPLRYHIESYPRAWQKKTAARGAPVTTGHTAPRDTLPITDRFEFWVRFVCGALLGAFVSFRLVIDLFDYPKILLVAVPTLIVLTGLGVARYGDRFWLRVLAYWW